ncbi:cytochrome P450 [Pseudoduganella violacea]|uniref:Cytochrome P450 n=1 Tax=Pseudoduganella violacea TaxID=1715466 RepID=A0A7W5B9Z3_9BURK|nr:cytochrome P450 [Pseudoduganella violacea]MBB3119233.1 cytochrome P450 [Pseudoduganella violacea]
MYFDPIAAVTQSDPYPGYAALAARSELVFDEERKLWLAGSPVLVRAVMANLACRVRPVAEAVPAAIAGGSAGQVFGQLVRMNDGARHVVPKLVLQRALAALPLEAAQLRAASLAQALPPALHAARTRLDGARLSAWMCDVPVQTMASLLGFAPSQLPALSAWMRQFVACLSPLSSPEQLALAQHAARFLLDSFSDLLRSAPPAADSLLGAVLAEAEAAGWNNAQAILANLVGLLSQTYEATAGLIGNAIVDLLRAPQRASEGGLALVRDVALNDPSIQNTRRFVAEATRIGSVELQPGDVVLLVLAAASRARDAQGQVFGFGHGAHTCPGQALAVTIAAAAIDVLLQAQVLEKNRYEWRYRPSHNARIPEFFNQGEEA